LRGEEVFGVAPKLNVIQRWRLRLEGSIFIGYRQPIGWLTGLVPIYIVRCSEHGLYIDTLHGWKELPICSLCRYGYSIAKVKQP
jgi:hypothetical protein